MGIHICSNKGADPFWDPIKGKTKENLNAVIFGRMHPCGKEIQVCLNEVPRVISAPRAYIFTS